MKTLLELTRLSESYLKDKGVKSPRLEAEWLIAETLKVSRLSIYTESDRPIAESEQVLLREVLKRRGNREPLQYILGHVTFLNCTLKVNPHVLIPRPETEILADKIIKAIPPGSTQTFWDLCCGSGAIGIAVKKAHPGLTVVLSDISEEALEVARENGRLNHVQVEFLKGDFLAPFAGRKTDYLATNPPYISETEFSGLEPEVKDFEPKGALVSGHTGFEFYERLSLEAPLYVTKGAIVWMELGPKNTEKLFENPFWERVKTELDLSGLPRYLTLVQNPLNFK